MTAMAKDWTVEALTHLYQLPLPELLYQAMTVHRAHHDPSEIQLCTLANIKSGNCSEDCSYCPQSARYQTDIETWQLPSVESVVSDAKAAQQSGSTRFCMGAAWREVRDNADFEHVLALVQAVETLGMEVCVTLGMLNAEQAQRLKSAGLKAYNHNIDTSPEFYPEIITTRTFEDRLRTIKNVSDAGIDVCCGGILGLGESEHDRIRFIQVLSQMAPAPESVPVNALVPVEGTPMAGQEPVNPIDLVRTIATLRIVIPTTNVRLSAGRTQMSPEAQALCFMAGANSIFTGEKLLTTPNPGINHDAALLSLLGMHPRKLETPVLV